MYMLQTFQDAVNLNLKKHELLTFPLQLNLLYTNLLGVIASKVMHYIQVFFIVTSFQKTSFF